MVKENASALEFVLQVVGADAEVSMLLVDFTCCYHPHLAQESSIMFPSYAGRYLAVSNPQTNADLPMSTLS